jgi:kinesin family protein C2/C3
VNARALEKLFAIAEEKADECELTVRASCLEVYCETLRDLLSKKPNESNLEIKIDKKGTFVPELIEESVTSVADVQKLIARSKKGRSTFATNMNEHSSRSHSMLSVTVETRSRWTGAATLGKLHLVDLAGSERVGKSEATGQRLKEAQAINKSLSALGDVIAALATRDKHVPFRNSKLTYYLQNALGGNSKVLMFVQCSPAEDNAQESSCSLLFATRARGVALGKATANRTPGKSPKAAKSRTAGGAAGSGSRPAFALDDATSAAGGEAEDGGELAAFKGKAQRLEAEG